MLHAQHGCNLLDPCARGSRGSCVSCVKPALSTLRCWFISMQLKCLYCSLQTVKLGVQYSLWGGSICNLGTERHRKQYFEDIDKFRLPGDQLYHSRLQLAQDYPWLWSYHMLETTCRIQKYIVHHSLQSLQAGSCSVTGVCCSSRAMKVDRCWRCADVRLFRCCRAREWRIGDEDSSKSLNHHIFSNVSCRLLCNDGAQARQQCCSSGD